MRGSVLIDVVNMEHGTVRVTSQNGASEDDTFSFMKSKNYIPDETVRV